MSDAALTFDAVTPAPTPRRWPGIVAIIAGSLAAFVLIGLVGSRQDAREERVLGTFTPVFLLLRDSGAATATWLQEHRYLAGGIGTAMLLVVVVAALAGRRRQALPVGLLVAMLATAVWAQVAVQSQATGLAVALYLAAAAAAALLGIWCPVGRLQTIPAFPPGAPGSTRAIAPRLPWGWECALVLGLVLAGLVSRTWALTELYDFLDLETVDWMVQGRTWNGFLTYLDFGFVQNNGGAVQVLPTQLVFRLFGTSVFTVRLTSVLWSIAAIPLMYWLGRRLAGTTAAVIASVLLITAPEQLFWARNENLHFAPIAVCALVTAHLSLWMVERFAPLAVVLTALWMPWCRWFYSACMVAFLIPIATGLHALVFGRGLWRKVWYVIPLLALGLVFWIFSLTAMRAALTGKWQFVDPSAVYGASAWRKHGEFRDASMADLIRLQAVSMSRNFATVLANMSYTTENFSHWCQRAQPAEFRTILNVGLALLLFVGLGYLLGQPHDRRAFLLLAWWGIATLPAILSQDPADRRMAMVFPATHALVGATVAAFVHLVWERGGRLAGWLATATAAIGLGLIALTNLSSHLQLPINPALYSDYPRFTKPLIEESDAIFTNIPGAFRNLSVLGNLDRFLAKPPCIQAVDPDRWLTTALTARCAYGDPIYHITIGDDAATRLRASYRPKRVSFLLTEDPSSAPHIALLQALFPKAELQRHPVPRAERTLVAMTVSGEDIAALRAPTLTAPAGTRSVLAGVRMLRPGAPAPTSADETPAPITVEGGILVEADGWYEWRLDPPCPTAQLALDGAAVAAAPQPMLAGVHPFTLTLPAASGCTLPLAIIVESAHPKRSETVDASRYVSRDTAELPEVRAPAADPYPGYGTPEQRIQFPYRPVDFGVDARGNISVLLRRAGDDFEMRRYDADGNQLAAWPVPVPMTINPASIAVAPDGTTAVLILRTVHFYAPDGREIATWEHPWLVWESQLAFWGDYLVTNIHHRNAIAVYRRNGELAREFKQFDGGPGKLYAPMSLALGAGRDMLVQQLDGTALRFQLDGPDFAPRFVEQFRVDSYMPGAGFDGPERILVPTERGLHVFGPGGRRLMAADPARDLTQQPLSNSLHIRRAGDRLYVLDSDRNTLWTLPE